MIRDITIGQYYPAKSILHRLDPRVKVVSTLLFLISLFLFRSIPGYIIATAFLVMVVRLSKVPFGYIVKGLKPIIMEEIRFLCRGKGHGLGFSQYGGNEMAKESANAKEILQYYFPEMDVLNIKSVNC